MTFLDHIKSKYGDINDDESNSSTQQLDAQLGSAP